MCICCCCLLLYFFNREAQFDSQRRAEAAAMKNMQQYVQQYMRSCPAYPIQRSQQYQQQQYIAATNLTPINYQQPQGN